MAAPTFKITDYAYQKRPCFCKKGRCLNCCNDVGGAVMDLTATIPAVGTYDTPDGGELEILRVSMDTANTAHMIFAPTGYPAGGTADEQEPSTICCYRPIGWAEWIVRDSMAAEVGHFWGCVWAGFNTTLEDDSAGKTIEIAFREIESPFRVDYWFYRDITASVSHSFPAEIGGTKTVYPLQSVICAATDFIELSNDTTIAVDNGFGLDVRATRATDTGLAVVGADAPSSCGNPCAISQEVTLALSISGRVLYDYTNEEFEPVEILAPDMSITFTVEIGCASYSEEFTSGTYDISNADFPDAVAYFVIAVTVDNEGRVMVGAAGASSGIIYAAMNGIGEEAEFGGAFEEDFQIGTVTCGEMTDTDGTVSMSFNDGSDGPFDITYTVT